MRYSSFFKLEFFEKDLSKRREEGKKLISLPSTENGDLYTWGDAMFGVLGHGERQESDPILQTTPKLVEYLCRTKRKKVRMVACGAYHTIALTGE